MAAPAPTSAIDMDNPETDTRKAFEGLTQAEQEQHGACRRGSAGGLLEEGCSMVWLDLDPVTPFRFHQSARRRSPSTSAWTTRRCLRRARWRRRVRLRGFELGLEFCLPARGETNTLLLYASNPPDPDATRPNRGGEPGGARARGGDQAAGAAGGDGGDPGGGGAHPGMYVFGLLDWL